MKKKAIRSLAYISLLSVLLSGCAGVHPAQKITASSAETLKEDEDVLEIITDTTQKEATGAEREKEAGTEKETETEVQDGQPETLAVGKLAGMTTEEKVAQLFIVLSESLTGVSNVVQAGDTTKEALKQYPVGGLIYMKNNILNPDQLKDMTTTVQKYSMEIMGLPLFLAVDEEGGQITRVAANTSFDVPRFQTMKAIGDTKDGQKAYEVGAAIGTYLADYGLNFDFAPDADVLSNPENKVIGSRSFGTSPELVSQMSRQVMIGLSDQKVQYALKHFPGHGATAEDSHKGFAWINKTREELEQCEFVPFADAIRDGADCIMVGHISVPAVTGDDTPVSLSKVMMTDILREDMGFSGVIVTDALNMGAIQNYYTSGEAAVKSFQAGADLLLMPADFHGAYEGVLAAVRTGAISKERLDESVMRILKLKYKWN